MNIRELTKILIDAGIEEIEAKREVEIFLEQYLGISTKDILLDKKISEDQFQLIKEKVLFRAKTRMPIQYITGKAWFMGEIFKVTPDVLIPRDETEILVRKAIEIINQENFSEVLDIGTGSGCIACSIAKNTEATVLGVDISTDALRVALDNVTNLGINNKAVFRKSDLFEKIREGESFDLIISNPPYISYNTKLSPEVMQEPSLALFADEEGLYFYRRIIEVAPLYLNDNGYLMFELGIGESELVEKFMKKDFQNIKIIKDLAGIDRVIIARKKS